LSDQIGLWIGFVLTLMVFSYLLGDNFLYRLAIYVFVGLSAGFITMITVNSVLLPWLRATFQSGGTGGLAVGLIPLVLGLLLLLKTTRRFNRLGNLAMGVIVGIGTAIALVGAISGTLLPLANQTAGSVAGDALNGFILVMGVVCTLIYFQYVARRVPGGSATRRGLVVRTFGIVGKGFIVITLGALYGGAILSGLVIVSERIAFILSRVGGG
jgi:hypothetical protein